MVGTNERRWLGPCIDALSKSHEDVQIIYVDNASGDGSAGFVRATFPSVTVIELDSNRGFAYANNVGLARAQRDGAAYGFLVNPDTRAPRDLVARLVSFMDVHPEYGVVGPLQTEYDADADLDDPLPLNAWSAIALDNGERNVFHDDAPRHPSHAGPADGRVDDTLEHAYVQGAAFFVRLEAAAAAGWLDPIYHTYYEETDLCRRVRWCGYRVALLLDATIQHHGGGSAPVSAYRTYHMLRNRYLFALTDPTWRADELARLCIRWAAQIARMTARPRPGDAFAPTPGIVARIAWWLLTHAPQIAARRRRNARLVRDGPAIPRSAPPRTAARDHVPSRATDRSAS